MQELVDALAFEVFQRIGQRPQFTVRARRGWPKPQPTFFVTVATSEHRIQSQNQDVSMALLEAVQHLLAVSEAKPLEELDGNESGEIATEQEGKSAAIVPISKGKKRTA